MAEKRISGCAVSSHLGESRVLVRPLLQPSFILHALCLEQHRCCQRLEAHLETRCVCVCVRSVTCETGTSSTEREGDRHTTGCVVLAFIFFPSSFLFRPSSFACLLSCPSHVRRVRVCVFCVNAGFSLLCLRISLHLFVTIFSGLRMSGQNDLVTCGTHLVLCVGWLWSLLDAVVLPVHVRVNRIDKRAKDDRNKKTEVRKWDLWTIGQRKKQMRPKPKKRMHRKF